MKTNHILAATLLATTLLTGAARAEVVMIVNTQNPATPSAEDIRRIMSGRYNQFPSAGTAVPMLRSARWEGWAECTQKFLGKSPSEVERNWMTRVFSGQSEPPKVIVNDAEAVQAVATNRGAITCVSEQATQGITGVRIVAR